MNLDQATVSLGLLTHVALVVSAQGMPQCPQAARPSPAPANMWLQSP